MSSVRQNNTTFLTKISEVNQFYIVTIKKYMLKAHCYRVHPSTVQQRILRMQFGAVRFVYNYFLAEQQDRYEKKEPYLSFLDLCLKLVALKDRA